MIDFTKDVCIGVKETCGGRRYSVWCQIGYSGGRLSITGVEGATQGGGCLGSCGQIYDELTDFVRLEPKWTTEMLTWFIGVWKKWHLNDLHAVKVPESVLDALANLPESKKSYAWI